jgi:2-polyprenyl-6-methoxyphenol hydroxylase-like FAD-dependent oxidoreductase
VAHAAGTTNEENDVTNIERVDVCVVGAGPAGMTLALDLARRGVEVLVLEQTKDFDRSFRGESISPDSVWLLDRLGVLDGLREQQILFIDELELSDGGRPVLTVDFHTFDQPMPLPAEIPQPMLLTALTDAASVHPSFSLRRQSKVVDLLRSDDGRVTGVRVRTPHGEQEIHARLVVGADGRYSKLREAAGLAFTKIPLERDFLWFKVPYPATLKPLVYRVRIERDQHAMLIPTWPDLLRVGVNIPKNGLKQARAAGISAIHDRVRVLAPEITDITEHVRSWSDVSMLEIFTAVLPHWSTPGLVLIGDAAHTLSPVLAQGVNHAIIDAVTLAPLVTGALRSPYPEAALDAAGPTFQQARESAVARARGVQLRQEKVFAFGKPAQIAVRRALYRTINRLPAVKSKIWSTVYYTVPQTGGRPVPPPTTAAGPTRPEAAVTPTGDTAGSATTAASATGIDIDIDTAVAR